MTGRGWRFGILLLATAGLAACGAEFVPGDDGGTPSCQMAESVSPGSPEADGSQVEVTADVIVNDVAGVRSYDWSVTRTDDGSGVSFTTTGADGAVIAFTPDVPGVYRVELSGSVGATLCSSDRRDVNVGAPGAMHTAFVLRVQPPSGAATPGQDIDVNVPGGADYALGTVSLASGLDASGVAVGPGGVPLAAYLRATQVASGADPPWGETFAGIRRQLQPAPGEGKLRPAGGAGLARGAARAPALAAGRRRVCGHRP